METQPTNQSQSSSIDAKDFLIGSLVGGIVGAAAAFLLAPKSGKELRTDLNDQASVIKDKSTEVASLAKEKSSNLVQAVSNQTSQAASRVKDLSSSVRGDFVTWRETKDNEQSNLADVENEAESYKDKLQSTDQELNKLELEQNQTTSEVK